MSFLDRIRSLPAVVIERRGGFRNEPVGQQPEWLKKTPRDVSLGENRKEAFVANNDGLALFEWHEHETTLRAARWEELSVPPVTLKSAEDQQPVCRQQPGWSHWHLAASLCAGILLASVSWMWIDQTPTLEARLTAASNERDNAISAKKGVEKTLVDTEKRLAQLQQKLEAEEERRQEAESQLTNSKLDASKASECVQVLLKERKNRGNFPTTCSSWVPPSEDQRQEQTAPVKSGAP